MKAIEKITRVLLKDDWTADSELFCGKDCYDCDVSKTKKDLTLSEKCGKYKRIRELYRSLHLLNDIFDLMYEVFRQFGRNWKYATTKNIREDIKLIIKEYFLHLLKENKNLLKCRYPIYKFGERY